jgi:hypothetical protein
MASTTFRIPRCLSSKAANPILKYLPYDLQSPDSHTVRHNNEQVHPRIHSRISIPSSIGAKMTACKSDNGHKFDNPNLYKSIVSIVKKDVGEYWRCVRKMKGVGIPGAFRLGG